MKKYIYFLINTLFHNIKQFNIIFNSICLGTLIMVFHLFYFFLYYICFDELFILINSFLFFPFYLEY